MLTGSRRAYAGDTPWAICNGIVQAQIAAPTARLREQERERSREAARLCIDERPRDQPAAASTRPHWVIPELVAEVRFTEWTRDRRLRHPVFLGLREDKKGRDVVLDPAIGTALDRTAGDNEVSARVLEHRTLRSN